MKKYENNWDPRRRRKRRAEGILEQIIAENFLNLVKGTSIKIQQAQRISLKINKNRPIPHPLIVKLTSLRDKEKILEASQDKSYVTCNSRNIRLAADISTETWQARKYWHDIFRVLNEKNMQPRILYPAKLSLKRERAIKRFQDRQKRIICKHQTSSTGNIERGPLSKERD